MKSSNKIFKKYERQLINGYFTYFHRFRFRIFKNLEIYILDMSPMKKKTKLSSNNKNILKRGNEEEAKIIPKSESNVMENIQASKRKNFIKACEQVSCSAYLNYAKRFELVYLPMCMHINNCNHDDKILKINPIPQYAEESFSIEIKTNMWHDALEVCFMCLTPNQYLTSNVLKNIIEIMLNAHEDPDADFTTSHLIEKCQQILSQNFSTHPPCHIKPIRKNYNHFLTSPMDLKQNTFTNRSEFGYENGIVKYCMNRLDYELSLESKDEPLVNKYENVPEEMKQSVKGLHWQKEKFEIYEALHRNDRIKRLFAVLESVIELLQFDLAIWHSRYNCNTASQIMRSHRPLMALVLWSNNILYTGAVNNNCRQILRIFVYLVHLQYPEEYLRIITLWLNSIIQTFYICENNSNSDYPNTGKYCAAFAKELYKTIQVLPQESICRILKRIRPTFMQHLIGCMHIKTIISTKEDDIIQIITNFIKKTHWDAENSKGTLVLSENCRIEKKIKNASKYLSKIIHKIPNRSNFPCSHEYYPKYDDSVTKYSYMVDRFHVISILYITLTAYLDAFSVQDVQDTLDTLNEQLETVEHMEVDENCIPEYSSYTATENFIKTYRSIYTMLKELMLILHELKSNKKMPEILKIFENISLLGLKI